MHKSTGKTENSEIRVPTSKYQVPVERWTLVKLKNNKFHVVSTSGKLIKIDEIIEVENNE